MNIITIKNHVYDLLSSDGLVIREPLKQQEDRSYALLITNITEQRQDNFSKIQNAQCQMDISCTSKSATDCLTIMNQVVSIVNQPFVIEGVNVSSNSIVSSTEDIDPVSGINTIMLTVQINYITRT
ncbi:hypothetical protein DT73_13105 [Mangrovibacter sp. MFB070]|uniref:hypothetical protein n=1 Tax=Mangrovibacter sp. MFB070 TaxID=1224318 RepID=UPI0004D645C4|nr:hypothetical protein [Mangrovibacter sp. MFB070]KEA51866.1 hypothetical protein DT73_13105 [Mangrovibacter sp. MFB070]